MIRSFGIHGVCMLAIIAFALPAAAETPEPRLHHCPLDPLSDVQRLHLNRMRAELAADCLTCEDDRCQFSNTVLDTELPLCHAVFCRPATQKSVFFFDDSESGSGFIRFSYRINKKGRATGVKVLENKSNIRRRPAKSLIRSMLAAKRYEPIVLGDTAYELENLIGTFNWKTEFIIR